MLLEALIKLRKESEMSMIIVEQHAKLALEIAEQGMVIERGQVRVSGSRESLLQDWTEIEDMLAVTH